jgi:hypothetical protein
MRECRLFLARFVDFSFASADHDLPAAFLEPGDQSRVFFKIISPDNQSHGIYLLSKKMGRQPGEGAVSPLFFFISVRIL